MSEKCPFVSEKGPECPFCGAPPESVNVADPSYYHCDECGKKWPKELKLPSPNEKLSNWNFEQVLENFGLL